jgi:hypothetical protein
MALHADPFVSGCWSCREQIETHGLLSARMSKRIKSEHYQPQWVRSYNDRAGRNGFGEQRFRSNLRGSAKASGNASGDRVAQHLALLAGGFGLLLAGLQTSRLLGMKLCCWGKGNSSFT